MRLSPEQSDVILLMRLVGAIHRIQENTMERYTQQFWGLTAGQMRLLLSLSPDQATRTLEVALRLFTDPGTVSGLLRRLIRKGLVSAVQSPADRRVQLVSLTPAGREVREQFFARWDEDPQWRQMASVLSNGLRSSLREVLGEHARSLLGDDEYRQLIQRLQVTGHQS